MKVLIRIFGILLLLILVSCNNQSRELKSVYVGMTSYEYYQKELKKKDKLERYPPPPFSENIVPFGFFESNDKVVFYQLPVKPRLCGISRGENSSFEYYEDELLLLKKSDLIEVNEKNIEEIVTKRILKALPRDRGITIAISKTQSDNKIILQIVRRMIQELYTTSWKVRLTNKYEMEILLKI